MPRYTIEHVFETRQVVEIVAKDHEEAFARARKLVTAIPATETPLQTNVFGENGKIFGLHHPQPEVAT